ncbi:rna-dependent rna polymeras-like protein [Lindgomyces ingoldianus]|uniref:Rna-dependent rna polymeras-like protein n=1 Tax=Lindgomyces ingoldianus TaxID=673940 RepID=A0ACB6QKW6_9PLEO|nr:rna-dependent rna polymeras-like protein [Lindgomyces ingoldianus]KAF2466775.1 rna-dependent rna polymeras-like protein [Lindgomyces ingoldianus]
MDIFITKLPREINQNEVKVFLKPYFSDVDILAFDVRKRVGKCHANITTPNLRCAECFLQKHGGDHSRYPPKPLNFRGKDLYCKQGKSSPTPLNIQALREDNERLLAMRDGLSRALPVSKPSRPIFPFIALQLGTWTYNHLGKLAFDEKYKDGRSGTVTFGKNAFVIYLQQGAHANLAHCRIDISYSIIEHVVPSAGHGKNPIISFTLRTPPKIFKIINTDEVHLYSNEESPITTSFERLSLDPAQKRLRRLCRLNNEFEKANGLCVVYRLALADMGMALQVWQFVGRFSVIRRGDAFKTAIPETIFQRIEIEYKELEKCLSNPQHHPNVGYDGRFQLLALALEGSLSPNMIQILLPDVDNLAQTHGSKTVAEGIRQLTYALPIPGLQTPASKLSKGAILQTLIDNVKSLLEVDAATKYLVDQQKQQDHLVRTLAATVTPTGILLRGPDLGISNRVLRRYSGYTEYFMRVSFADEDGVSLLYDSRASQEEVYDRFKSVLQGGIPIAGRVYKFLGFSHSSLRSHTVWFMAPFQHEGTLIIPSNVIAELGDFSSLHISAKCAARIGQAFSDTMFSIPIPKDAFVTEHMADVERFGKIFSDGCGTISPKLLQKIWRTLPPGLQGQKPTVLQIRYRGAKGVISLDTRLIGEQLNIRKSMTKFPAGESWQDLEICGGAYRPLTMYLNHQFIKILEDLKVPHKNILDVQNDAIQELKMMLGHPRNAASFLEKCRIGTSAWMPKLLELLHAIGLSFYADKFLMGVLEIAAMSTLRDMKYRARIPVAEGDLLYGIMDESNTLREGEVYIATRTQRLDGEPVYKVHVYDRVAITRAPALHPGDIQVVRAIDAPNNSYLKGLYNCVVFSQQGNWDLPSQLSGGDLDGDLFHVIYDKRLIPSRTEQPGEYKAAQPKDLGRPAKRDDIIDFFIEYMQSDQLGRISNMHKILADHIDEGTKHSDCRALAELASHAVDFSKSGQPVAMADAPKAPYHLKPDFMAPSPNIALEDKGVALMESETNDIDDLDSISLLDPDQSRLRYYRSKQILGKLYRTIDEQAFFNEMKKVSSASSYALGNESLMERLERYIDRETIGLQWKHHLQFAEEIREFYSKNIFEIMTSLATHHGEPLKELEVFSGNILGKKSHDTSRSVREANQEIRERFNRDVTSVVNYIVRGERAGDEEEESLPRAIACFKVSLQKEGRVGYERELRSFKYVAAAVCLERLVQYRGGILRSI